ncbi:acyl-CoA reductase-like NAD-dependent aldehyde dehydrogenase [Allocatelliglobosispora scoriae]|uniref:Acyl-CoA reductase-like NAD-dependent aldehyde dehydrogenase n=1 Tax=Allocatelliglobosispora scoriae TaxID=643052 RepID=A0A841BKQ1_9ACTN|nr:aldehyde dehydrogenase [Allocatelliglobosispora scoriae]MBB5867441.1 acyl-CoA reductase-like NAD-dependent aldehyde dehydrogenase [Allocatelliglobosispora scoriae]
MKSYGVLVGGHGREGKGWAYVARTSALLADPLTVGRLTLNRERDGGDEDDERLAGRVAVATAEQVAEALRAARAAQPEWGRRPLAERLELAGLIYRELVRRADELIDVLVDEGHPVRLARWELSGMLASFHPDSVALAAELAERRHQVGQHRVRLRYRPDGVVCLSPPQNAATSNSALGIWALIGGNALVVGAPRSCPLGVNHLYQEIVAPQLGALGAPPAVLSVLCGLTRPMLASWLDSADVDDIYYFGSSTRGLALAQECLARGKKPVLELSGNDGVLVWRDADVVGAAAALAECFYGSGQICMVPRYAVAHPAVFDQLVDAVAAHARALRPGLPDDPDVLLSPVFKAPAMQAVLRQATDAGATIVTGGRQWDRRGRPSSGGMFLEPTVLRVDGLEMADGLAAVRDETFFPLLSIVLPTPSDDGKLLTRVIAFMNANRYGLRNSLWARDEAVIDRVCADLGNGGILKVNDSHIGFTPVLPTHGGTGITGGPFGGAAIPLLRTTTLQAICAAAQPTRPLQAQ